jgi:hypothetical protein
MTSALTSFEVTGMVDSLGWAIRGRQMNRSRTIWAIISQLGFALLVAIYASTAASGDSVSTDHTDLWWNANESGEGFNVIDQSAVLFITFFVYGTDGKATWYVAPDLEYVPPTNPAAYSGALYQTTGPWFGQAFDPSAVGVRQVGTATFNVIFIQQATLTYSVDGVVVTKALRRQTWRTNDPTGDYYGGLVGTFSNCVAGIANGHVEQLGDIAVTLSGSQLTITTTGNGAVCNYFGTYSQDGHMGSVNSGTYSCTDGTVGSFSAFEIETSISGITGRASSTSNICTFVGRFGGVRRGTAHL